ncbi:MAG: hypothetical protein DMG40_04730 [Acidobacteria bacterium]|nr:MAG: hypothetical protein DMG40_04730 [Acidobacteriota bacterium]
MGPKFGHQHAWTLSMSTSNELEPGPKNFGKPCARKLVQGMRILTESPKPQAKARRVGWGGFIGG